jgi:hypothetical protein
MTTYIVISHFDILPMRTGREIIKSSFAKCRFGLTLTTKMHEKQIEEDLYGFVYRFPDSLNLRFQAAS